MELRAYYSIKPHPNRTMNAERITNKSLRSYVKHAVHVVHFHETQSLPGDFVQRTLYTELQANPPNVSNANTRDQTVMTPTYGVLLLSKESLITAEIKSSTKIRNLHKRNAGQPVLHPVFKTVTFQYNVHTKPIKIFYRSSDRMLSFLKRDRHYSP